MNKEEIQKLIGGYASGTLSGSELRRLFEAALEDQELFDALQQEQALKELLDDPVSREKVRRAAAKSLPEPRVPWFRQPWIWAAVTSAAAAAVLLVVLTPWNPKPAAVKQVAMTPLPVQTPAALPQIAEKAPVPPQARPSGRVAEKDVELGRKLYAKKEAPPQRELEAATQPAGPPMKDAGKSEQTQNRTEQAQNKSEQMQKTDNIAVLTPPPPAPVQPQTRDGAPDQLAQQRQVQQQGLVMPSAAQQGAGIGKQAAPLEKTAKGLRTTSAAALAGRRVRAFAPVNHSFARRQDDGSYSDVPAGTVFHPGDTIRLTIVPDAAGLLAVSEWDATSSSWKRLFPREGEGLRVRALDRYTVPADIVVKPGERLRVSIGPAETEIPVAVR